MGDALVLLNPRKVKPSEIVSPHILETRENNTVENHRNHTGLEGTDMDTLLTLNDQLTKTFAQTGFSEEMSPLQGVPEIIHEDKKD